MQSSIKIVEKTRRKYLEYEQREKEILACSIRLFNEKGYKDATTAAIARESGISEPILYKHFENKKELFLCCFHAIADELMARYKAIFKNCRDDELGYIKGVVRAYVDFVVKNPDKSMFLVHLMSYKSDPDFADTFTQFMEDSIGAIERVLNRAKAKGKIKESADTRFLAAMFVSQYFTVVAMQDFIEPGCFTGDTHFDIMESLMGS
ncbi:MAG: TetR/AcrR family transcriptional regulator [Desulfatibacillum sp.]|nr:TetR/AcrR family transcriptional regulator [Desulfatibacillum sp.]